MSYDRKNKEMKVSRIAVKNFKSFKELNLDGFQEFAVLIGQNGTGKSNLLSLFSFLSECVTVKDVDAVVEHMGIDRLCHSGNLSDPIEIAVTFRFDALKTAQYMFKIGYERYTSDIGDEEYEQYKAIVEEEQLIVSEKVDGKDRIRQEIFNKRGMCQLRGKAEQIEETDLALSILGRLTRYEEAVAIYEFLKGVRVVNFALTTLREDDPTCDGATISNLGYDVKSVALEMQKKYPEKFAAIVEHMECAIGITAIRLQEQFDRHISLSFTRGTREIPEPEISDGTLSLFAYYLLLEQSRGPSILCIEHPERNISYNALKQLAEVMRKAARKGHVQIVVTSHSLEFISALKLNEVFYVYMEEQKTFVKPLYGNKELELHLSDSNLGELYTTGFIDVVL